MQINAYTNAKLIALLVEGIFTIPEVTEETGLSYCVALRYVRELHRVGVVHIAGWGQASDGRLTLRIFKLGRGKDTPRPARVSVKERSQKYRNKLQAIKLNNMFAGKLP